jgi:hypothetical protein
MANMTDRTRATGLMDCILRAGSALTFPTALRLRLIKTLGSNTSNGTELAAAQDPGYTAPSTVAIIFAANSGGVYTQSNTASWTATGTWTDAINGVEIWDTAGTPLRWLQGALTSAITASTVVNGDTVQFASSVSADVSQW